MKTALVMGFRKQIVQALGKKSIPYYIWNDKPVKSKTNSLKTVIQEFPLKKEDLLCQFNLRHGVTHVIAGTEGAVLPASKARLWLGTERNPKEVIERCSDKLKMKSYLKEFAIPMTPFYSAQTKLSAEDLFSALGSPFLIKERRNSGGKGINYIKEPEDLSRFKKVITFMKKSLLEAKAAWSLSSSIEK